MLEPENREAALKIEPALQNLPKEVLVKLTAVCLSVLSPERLNWKQLLKEIKNEIRVEENKDQSIPTSRGSIKCKF